MRATLTFLRFLLYHLYSQEKLVAQICGHLASPDLYFIPEFSGRTALVAVAEKVARRTEKRTALVPDYICNAVHMALEKVGFTAVPYATDCRCEPDTREIEAAIIRCDAAVLLTANVFGSSAMLDWLSLVSTREFLASRNVFVVADLCQDIRLVKRLPTGYGQWLDAIVSFNDKSFPGIMGGGVMTAGGIEGPQRCLTVGQTLHLYYHLGWKWAREWRPRRCERRPVEYDRSTCSPFPYELEQYRPHRVQLIMAVLGLKKLDWYAARKQVLLADYRQRIVRTRFVDTAPYIVFGGGETPPPGRRHKQPYAMASNFWESLRPDQVIVHNKGFYDRHL
jgi:hypothetical protein